MSIAVEQMTNSVLSYLETPLAMLAYVPLTLDDDPVYVADAVNSDGQAVLIVYDAD